jgi:hypothetical protein
MPEAKVQELRLEMSEAQRLQPIMASVALLKRSASWWPHEAAGGGRLGDYHVKHRQWDPPAQVEWDQASTRTSPDPILRDHKEGETPSLGRPFRRSAPR